jgi:NADH-quinone oxidoreductase subunit J
MIHSALFFTFALCAVLLAIGVVTTRRILRAAVYLTGVLFCGAVFYLLLQVEFLAGVQVLVYIGGIVVLLVFAVMLTSSLELLEDHPSRMRRVTGLVGAVAFFALTAVALLHTDFGFLASPQRTESDVHEIGRRLLDSGAGGYVLPFEVISVLLLASVIGGIVVARKVHDAAPAAATNAPGAPSGEGSRG